MKVTILWVKSTIESENEKTAKSLERELRGLRNVVDVMEYSGEYDDRFDWFNSVFEKIDSDYVTAINSGDFYKKGSVAKTIRAIKKNPQINTFCQVRIRDEMDHRRAAFSSDILIKRNTIIDLEKQYNIFPFYFWGNWISKKIYKNYRFDLSKKYNAERELFIRALLDDSKIMYLAKSFYYLNTMVEGAASGYAPSYDMEWYYDGLVRYWLDLFEEIKSKMGQVPLFMQYQAIYSLTRRISVNTNNKNKHLFDKDQVEEYFMSLKPLLLELEDRVIFNGDLVNSYSVATTLKGILGRIKYGKDLKFEAIWDQDVCYLGCKGIKMVPIAELANTIQMIEYVDNKIEIDGSINSALYLIADDIYLEINGEKYSLTYNERYSLTKAFGKSIYKNATYHVSVPIEKCDKARIRMIARVGQDKLQINYSYNSHFTKVSVAFWLSYWYFGNKKKYMATAKIDEIKIRRSNPVIRFFREIGLWFNMLFYPDLQTKKFLLLRMAYFVFKPFIKTKPIWMYMDKMYKAGDSSEYLYKYALEQKDNIKHYYLVDKKSTDYKRLVDEGYKPLVRGSWLHRLIFLYSDVILATNSTVCAFNNYGMPNSSYMRDLLNFGVVCLQHGLSVQKIAIAQNRLRDNTKLYCCASKYEIENLSKPVYDYVGYDALKLTGIPRYDGLKDRHKKQIMISPTWRMQAAMAVKTNEGEQRDYNPLFKESEYYKVYNSLINDRRLIEAAKQYGYRIKYVLHPIVSSQVEDFDKNDYVDIVPSVGDMSYEDMFCESALMVTDFSGVQFDFAYMRKPVVYLHHEDIPQHYEEGAFFYDTMGFGEICHTNDELIDALIEYMKQDCKMKEEYVRRADDFFYYSDHENCKRVYETILMYQGGL